MKRLLLIIVLITFNHFYPQISNDYLNSGYDKYKEEKYEEAIPFFNKVIEFDPGNIMAFFLRGECYKALKKYDDALRDFNKVIILRPNDAVVYMERGQCVKKLSGCEKAIDDYSKAIELDHNYGDPYFFLGTCYYELQKYSEAIQSFSKLIELEPDDYIALIYRGRSYESIKNYEEAIRNYTKVIELKPDESEGYMCRGDIYFRLSQFENALSDYNKIFELSKSSGDLLLKEFYIKRAAINDSLDNKSAAAYDYWQAGELVWLFSLNSDYEGALKHLNRAIELDSTFYRTYMVRGDIYHQKGNFEEAYRNYSKSIALTSDSLVLADLYLSRAGNYFGFDKYIEAINDLSSMLKLHPSYPQAFLCRGNCYYKLQKYDNAISDFKTAAEHYARSDFKNMDFGLGEITDVESEPKDTVYEDAYAGLGYICFKKKEYKEALQYFGKCPGHLNSKIGMSITYFNMGDFINAGKYFNEAKKEEKKIREEIKDLPKYKKGGCRFFGFLDYLNQDFSTLKKMLKKFDK